MDRKYALKVSFMFRDDSLKYFFRLGIWKKSVSPVCVPFLTLIYLPNRCVVVAYNICIEITGVERVVRLGTEAQQGLSAQRIQSQGLHRCHDHIDPDVEFPFEITIDSS